jgi:hypothetical protein
MLNKKQDLSTGSLIDNLATPHRIISYVHLHYKTKIGLVLHVKVLYPKCSIENIYDPSILIGFKKASILLHFLTHLFYLCFFPYLAMGIGFFLNECKCMN